LNDNPNGALEQKEQPPARAGFRKPAVWIGATAVLTLSIWWITRGGMQIPMTYVPEGFPLGLSATQGFALHLFDTPSEIGHKFKKLPPNTQAARYYDTFDIAGAEYHVLTEESAPPRMYFDANDNGDLTDDGEPAEAERYGEAVPNFYTIPLPPPDGGEPALYRFWIFPSNQGGTRFYAACHTAGQLKLAQSYRMVLFDANANGDWSDDPLVIDANGNGAAEENEKLIPGKSLTIEQHKVRLKSIAPDGRSVRLVFY
jgi:hypothetical protein